ncbi:pentatricopeptide repeat-containing protein 1, mitochondrial [Onthophagus taurus]|uniref:pentatricopeptide repeat-containing protein 1, mitochondrial n=1 Tax=Onthophagus taurus TaxID=166361 RepID=UPI0039BDEDFF
MYRSNLIKLLRTTIVNKQFVTSQTQNSIIPLKLTPNKVNNLCCKCITSKPVTSDLQKEEQYLVKVKDDPDTFGGSAEKKIFDLDDEKEEKFLKIKPDPSQKLRTKQYADMIKDLIRKKKIKEAIDLVEVRMIQEDRVKPQSYIFNLVLGACGRVGYTKKAFSLYNKMKQRGLNIHPGTYTALFNACANNPWLEDGLTRAKHLREIMIEKGYEPNDTNYNSMIKAFGRCGDLNTAFELVDEMSSKKIPVKEDTINFLLQSCVSDKDAGFRHALLVWRKFYQKRLNPDIYSFNLLLKCTNDCNLGDLEVTKDVIDNILKKNVYLNEPSSQLLLNEPQTNLQNTSNNSLAPIDSNITDYRPNLIARIPHLGNIVSLSEVKSPEDRFLLLGGISGFLQTMAQNRCVPNIKTFTQLLNLIPGTLAAEKELIGAMKKANVKPDADFYNMLMKKRSIRFDYESAKEVLEAMSHSNTKPNIMTYGILALGCKTKEEAEEFMARMNEGGFRMNTEILGAMLHQACYHCNFKYVFKIMEICIKEEIRPNSKFMGCLEEFKKKCKRLSNDNTSNLGQSKPFINNFQVFKTRHNVWKTQVDPILEDEEHPWQQFRQNSETNVKHVKDKEKSSRFKPRHLSLYRQKKGAFITKKNDKGKLIKGENKKIGAIQVEKQKFIE